MTFRFPNIPDREAELLGLVLNNPVSIHQVVDRVPETAFHNDLTRTIWREMLALTRSGTKISIPMLREKVKADPARFGIPDLATFLMTCCDRVDGDVSLDDLAEVMADHAALDSVQSILKDAQEKIAKGQSTGADLALSLKASLDRILTFSVRSENVTLAEAALAYANEASNAFQTGAQIGMDWGLKPIDRIAGTFIDGDFIVLGGPSYHGKSVLAHQIIMHIASRRPVLQIQPEMKPEMIAGRELVTRTGVSSKAVRAGEVTQADIEKILLAAKRLEGLPYEVCHTGDMRVSKIRSRIESFKHRYGDCGLVVVDTIKHVDPEDKSCRGLIDRVQASAHKLYRITKDLNVTMMVLAQVKEEFYKRSDVMFHTNDLFGGGELGQLADIVLLMQQPAQKMESLSGRDDREQAKLDKIINDWKGLAQIKCTKARNGRMGEKKLRFNPDRVRFEDPEDEQEVML
ncbi:DnaB-like helicase C-terminal domain-containing protein [Roseibium sediminis]|uniref:DnaB-like helicase C-terminal domain-containing protein n=1 Tax=Roseibium sediminis TaxID=1775174 RepID=UPI00123D7E61|nr:DnaB-like helicase C-terminal domain-containing protein [Roseibium sediminis]